MNTETNPNPPPTADPAVASSALLGHLRTDCLNALHCLYIATEPTVADDVNRMVKTYIAALETRIAASCPNLKQCIRRALEPEAVYPPCPGLQASGFFQRDRGHGGYTVVELSR